MRARKSCYSWRNDWQEGGVLERATREGLSYYRHAAWQDLRHGIFTRHGGVSAAPYASLNLGGSIGDEPAAVRENHRRMYRALDLNPARARSCWLVHGVRTLVIDCASSGNREPGQLEQADAIITDQADLPLVMRYADCAPLLFYDPVRRAIGLGHAGWRGTVKGIASHIVSQMARVFRLSSRGYRSGHWSSHFEAQLSGWRRSRDGGAVSLWRRDRPGAGSRQWGGGQV